MPEKYQLLSRVLGYYTKPDRTNAPVEVLIAPSQNVIINDQEMAETRGGYERLGAANTATSEIESSFDWETSTGVVISLRSYDDELEVYTSGLGTWTRLKNSLTAVNFSFATYWVTAEKIDVLLFVDGTSNLYEWSGGIATILSVTANTITKTGTGTWAESRFFTAGTRKVVINGVEYTYTGGETTTTLTGVTGDPLAGGVVAGDVALQAIRTYATTPAANYNNDFIKVKDNQLWVGSNTSRYVYVSKNSAYATFTYSTPRIPGDGALLTLDNVGRAFKLIGSNMGISAGRDDWYISEFKQLDVGGTLTETLNVKKLNSGEGYGAQSQDLISGDYYISFEPTLRKISGIDESGNLITQNLSDPIKPDFDTEDFTGGHIKEFRNRILISAPSSDRVYINELRQKEDGTLVRFWQPPQILPVQKFAVIGGELYGHSNSVPETYRLFYGTNDNGNSFKATAAYSYRSYQDRQTLKSVDEWSTEGYITANTILEMTLKFDYGGYTQTSVFEIDGSDVETTFVPVGSGSLGDNPLGDVVLGDTPEDMEDYLKFKIVHGFPSQDFFEIQVVYSTDQTDFQWKIMSQGGNVMLSRNRATYIKK